MVEHGSNQFTNSMLPDGGITQAELTSFPSPVSAVQIRHPSPRSQSHRQAISEAMSGKMKSPKHKEAIRASLLAYWAARRLEDEHAQGNP